MSPEQRLPVSLQTSVGGEPSEKVTSRLTAPRQPDPGRRGGLGWSSAPPFQQSRGGGLWHGRSSRGWPHRRRNRLGGGGQQNIAHQPARWLGRRVGAGLRIWRTCGLVARPGRGLGGGPRPCTGSDLGSRSRHSLWRRAGQGGVSRRLIACGLLQPTTPVNAGSHGRLTRGPRRLRGGGHRGQRVPLVVGHRGARQDRLGRRGGHPVGRKERIAPTLAPAAAPQAGQRKQQPTQQHHYGGA